MRPLENTFFFVFQQEEAPCTENIEKTIQNIKRIQIYIYEYNICIWFQDDLITRFHWLKNIHSLVDQIFAVILASSGSENNIFI